MSRPRARFFATPSRIVLAVATSEGRVCIVLPKGR
jgi:hypothetical protein